MDYAYGLHAPAPPSLLLWSVWSVACRFCGGFLSAALSMAASSIRGDVTCEEAREVTCRAAAS
eukprot:1913915-Prymnesium_polylepis.1